MMLAPFLWAAQHHRGLDTMTTIVSTASNVDDILNDFLSNFSIEKPTKVDTPEDHFMRYLTADKFSKMVIISQWLKNQIAIYDRAQAYGLYITVNTIEGTPKRAGFVRWARILIEHYLMTTHPHWFIAAEARHRHNEPADMGIVIDRILELEPIKKALFSENRA